MATSLSSECIQLVETLTIQQVFFFWEVHSSHAGFILYFSSCRPTQPSSPHIILIMFLSSPASSLTGYQIISQTDSRHEAVGGDQLRPHYDLSNKNSLQGWFISDLTRWQHRTQLDLRPQTSSCYRISQADRQRSGKKVRNLKSMLSSSSFSRQTQILP